MIRGQLCNFRSVMFLSTNTVPLAVSVGAVVLLPMKALKDVSFDVAMFKLISILKSCNPSFVAILRHLLEPSKYPETMKTNAITKAPATKSNVLYFLGAFTFVTSMTLDSKVLSSPLELESSMSVVVS